MNPLHRILQSLKKPPSKSWCLIITPDPRKFDGLEVLKISTFHNLLAHVLQSSVRQDGIFEFHMRLDGNMNLQRYLKQNPTFR